VRLEETEVAGVIGKAVEKVERCLEIGQGGRVRRRR
jgi:hypothetical protein